MIRAEIELTVPFHDIDLLGIAWHGHYCKYIELARCAMLDQIGYGYMTMKETGYVWPIVDLQLRYVRPAKFEQRIIAAAELVEYEYRMKIKYTVSDAETGTLLAKGHSVQAAVDVVTGEMCFASPPVFLQKLGVQINPVAPD